METLAFPLLVVMQPTCTQQYRSGERIHVTIRPRLLGNKATRQYRVVSVSMEVFNVRLPSNDGIRPNTSQYINITITIPDIIHRPVLYLKRMMFVPHRKHITSPLESNMLIRSISLWRRYINITLTILDIIHRPISYLKYNISTSGFCLRRQMETYLVRPNKATLCLRTETESTLRRVLHKRQQRWIMPRIMIVILICHRYRALDQTFIVIIHLNFYFMQLYIISVVYCFLQTNNGGRHFKQKRVPPYWQNVPSALWIFIGARKSKLADIQWIY
jgi:hypothetical protein